MCEPLYETMRDLAVGAMNGNSDVDLEKPAAVVQYAEFLTLEEIAKLKEQVSDKARIALDNFIEERKHIQEILDAEEYHETETEA